MSFHLCRALTANAFPPWLGTCGRHAGCLVSSSFNVTVTDRVQDLDFWGFVGALRAASFMEILLGKSNRYEYTKVTLNRTHAIAEHVGLTDNDPIWGQRVSREVSSGWRRFFLQVPGRNDAFKLNLSDDHGAMWLGGGLALPAVDWLRVVIPHFCTSCYTMTPTWRIEGRSEREVVLPPLLNYLQFTLMGSRPLLPMLTLGDTRINLTDVLGSPDGPPPPVPLVLHIKLIARNHQRHHARQVVDKVLGVVEVMTGNPVAALWFASHSDAAFHVVHQLHLSSTLPGRQDSPPPPCIPCSKTVGVADSADLPSHSSLMSVGWPVLLGAAVGLLLAGVGLGACVVRLLMTCRVSSMVNTIHVPSFPQPVIVVIINNDVPLGLTSPSSPSICRQRPSGTRTVTTTAKTTAQTMKVIPGQTGFRKEKASPEYEPQYLEPLPVPALPSPPTLPCPSPEHIYDKVDEIAAMSSLWAAEDSFTSEDDYDDPRLHFR
ncbi:hypothetical protein GWK47_043589 [Chionoecetes opilio]|uniref:Uncharacterized protein n=1 Tax=Chionoecetes opilio TaxID=41210 RepID=A0A8J4Y946_CHIOP|nr:hypothetical protein GWK47_043589 [Chionoecetes opilio]